MSQLGTQTFISRMQINSTSCKLHINSLYSVLYIGTYVTPRNTSIYKHIPLEKPLINILVNMSAAISQLQINLLSVRSQELLVLMLKFGGSIPGVMYMYV